MEAHVSIEDVDSPLHEDAKLDGAREGGVEELPSPQHFGADRCCGRWARALRKERTRGGRLLVGRELQGGR